MGVSSVVRLVTGPAIALLQTVVVVVVVPSPAMSSRLLLWAHGTAGDTDSRCPCELDWTDADMLYETWTNDLCHLLLRYALSPMPLADLPLFSSSKRDLLLISCVYPGCCVTVEPVLSALGISTFVNKKKPLCYVHQHALHLQFNISSMFMLSLFLSKKNSMFMLLFPLNTFF